MVVVALAGASTGLGLTILRQIVAAKKHKVVMLSRNPNPTISELGVDVRPVDYTSHESIVAALKDVHTLLSIIGSLSAEAMTDTQLALLKAAEDAGVKRFSASDYAMPSYEGIQAYAVKIPVWEAMKKSKLEITRFSPGLFMNTLGTGTPKGETEALGGLRPWTFIINVPAGTADLPGDGHAKLTFTDTWDIGDFVAASLDLDKWPQELEMVGDTKSYREVIEMLEKTTKRKFLIKESSIAELEDQIAKDPNTQFYNETRILLGKGGGVVQPTLNKLVPQVKPKSVQDYIDKWWGGVEDLPEPKWEAPRLFTLDEM